MAGKRPEFEIKKEEVVIPKAPDYDKINLKMMGNRILIQNIPNAEKIGSIFTPDNVEVPIDRGRICGIGPNVQNKELKVGDIFYKVSQMGQILKDSNRNEYIFLPENAVIAIDTDPERVDLQDYDVRAHE
ncbi:MAG: co-chaperone GroES [bacterium]|nr:co-chaperone GroES [bacterium]